MEEQNIPSLSQYEVENPHLFEVKLIQRMELTVLGALEWKMNMITPFSFIDYFVSKLCQESLSHVKSKIAGLLLSIITEINSMHQRPSAVAAAATLMALDQKLTKEALELKINSVSELKFLETEAVIFCYNRMQEKELKSLKDRLIPVNVVDNSSVPAESL